VARTERPAQPAAQRPAVELAGLARHYGERVALHDVSLTLPIGATLAVFGPNGAGKSTLLRVLATLLRPHAGVARVLGRELPRDAWAVRAEVGLLAHEPLLYRDLTARENLAYNARLHNVSPARIDELLDEVGMQRRADEPVRSLSRGMVQRIAVCRTVLHDPALLLLDEPLANLDPAATKSVEALVGRSSGATRIVTTHNIDSGLADADYALGLRAGRVRLLEPASSAGRAAIEELYR
jgi:heme exporter protein A